MSQPRLPDDPPLVSLILTTRDRPRLVTVALACYQHQTYPRRELIVVDDGERAPLDPAAVEAVGGRLIRVESGLPIGAKLNHGVAAARGRLCQKMDDDDWYGPDFLTTMVATLYESWRVFCQPTIAFLMPFLFFDVPRWEVRRSTQSNVPGATLLFAREDWAERPFRALPCDEDVWFVIDQIKAGLARAPVEALDSYLAVRHQGASTDRGHTWTRQWDNRSLEDYLLTLERFEPGPKAILPDWALAVYRDLHEQASRIDPSGPGGQARGAG